VEYTSSTQEDVEKLKKFTHSKNFPIRRPVYFLLNLATDLLSICLDRQLFLWPQVTPYI